MLLAVLSMNNLIISENKTIKIKNNHRYYFYYCGVGFSFHFWTFKLLNKLIIIVVVHRNVRCMCIWCVHKISYSFAYICDISPETINTFCTCNSRNSTTVPMVWVFENILYGTACIYIQLTYLIIICSLKKQITRSLWDTCVLMV